MRGDAGRWTEDEEAEPREGAGGGPYLIAEDAVRLVTPGGHGGAKRGLVRGLQAERQPPVHSSRVSADRSNGDPYPGANGQPSTSAASMATGPRGIAAANQRAACAANQGAEHERTLSGGTLGYQEEEGAAGGAQVAVETASLPSGASGREGPSNCFLEAENLILLLAAAPDPWKVGKCWFCLF